MPSIGYVEEAIVVAPGEGKCPFFFQIMNFVKNWLYPIFLPDDLWL